MKHNIVCFIMMLFASMIAANNKINNLSVYRKLDADSSKNFDDYHIYALRDFKDDVSVVEEIEMYNDKFSVFSTN